MQSLLGCDGYSCGADTIMSGVLGVVCLERTCYPERHGRIGQGRMYAATLRCRKVARGNEDVDVDRHIVVVVVCSYSHSSPSLSHLSFASESLINKSVKGRQRYRVTGPTGTGTGRDEVGRHHPSSIDIIIIIIQVRSLSCSTYCHPIPVDVHVESITSRLSCL